MKFPLWWRYGHFLELLNPESNTFLPLEYENQDFGIWNLASEIWNPVSYGIRYFS